MSDLLLSPLTNKAVYEREDHEARMVAHYASEGAYKARAYWHREFKKHLAAYELASQATKQRLGAYGRVA